MGLPSHFLKTHINPNFHINNNFLNLLPYTTNINDATEMLKSNMHNEYAFGIQNKGAYLGKIL